MKASEQLNLVAPAIPVETETTDISFVEIPCCPEVEVGVFYFNYSRTLSKRLAGLLFSAYHETPSYRTFGGFINEALRDSIEEIFKDINRKI